MMALVEFPPISYASAAMVSAKPRYSLLGKLFTKLSEAATRASTVVALTMACNAFNSSGEGGFCCAFSNRVPIASSATAVKTFFIIPAPLIWDSSRRRPSDPFAPPAAPDPRYPQPRARLYNSPGLVRFRPANRPAWRYTPEPRPGLQDPAPAPMFSGRTGRPSPGPGPAKRSAPNHNTPWREWASVRFPGAP